MAVAAFWGTSVGYTEYYNTVVVEKSDGRVAVFKKDIFDYLYIKLDDFTAALKEDCIEYVIHSDDRCLMSEPDWYTDAIADGLIFQESPDICVLYGEDGDILINQNSAIMRNYKGELRYLEGYKFHQYYDVPEVSE